MWTLYIWVQALFIYSVMQSCIKLFFWDETLLKSEFAVILASGQLQTIHSSVLYARGSRQHYATSCCVTLLYVSNVIFFTQRDTSHGVKLVSKWPWFPFSKDNLYILSLTLIGSSDWTTPLPSFSPPSGASSAAACHCNGLKVDSIINVSYSHSVPGAKRAGRWFGLGWQ